MPHPGPLQLIPLGGLGEFGMNLMVYRWGDDCIVLDAGVMFPGAEHPGVDVIVPDLSYLEHCGTLHAVVLTHGHEDHIGALPFFLARHDVPVYASPYTLGLVEERLQQQGDRVRPTLRPLPAGPLSLGPFVVQALPVAHSIPDSRMLVVRTPVGLVVHTADFKLDELPVDGVTADLGALATLGREGVLALLSDSTNADQPGRTPGERSIVSTVEPLVARAPGRVVVTTFASHIHRIRLLGQIAARHGRKLALVGAALLRHADVAQRLGLFSLPDGTCVSAEAVAGLAPRRLLVVAGGSQGEPASSMARIAAGRHRQVQVDAGDLVIHSARRIPGNEKSISRMINQLLRRGAEVVTAADAAVHVSGHASRDELRRLIELLRPRFLVPIHGEYRQLAAHARLAVESGLPSASVPLAESGDVVALDGRSIGVVDRVPAGPVFIDAARDRVGPAVLRDRRRIAGEGIVVPVVALHRESGTLDGSFEIMARGFVPLGHERESELMAEARRIVAQTLARATAAERRDEEHLRTRLQGELRRFLRRRTNRRPLVIPVILEL